MRQRRGIPQRSRIFLACEGESEQSYGVLLQKLAEAQDKRFFMVTQNLRGGGNPFRLANRAVEGFRREQAKAACVAKVIMLDADLRGQMPDHANRAEDLLRREGFIAIWQRPDHEGLLLRHFEGHERADPPAGRAMEALQAVWDGYRKNMSSSDLQKVLTHNHVLRAAGVEAPLMALLIVLGLVRVP